MRRFLSVFLALLLSFSCLTPALATENLAGTFPVIRDYRGFSDVEEEDWFEPYVALCCKTGLMEGTGEDSFSPGDTVTLAQTATLAARIHHILNGGDGTLPRAPRDWGTLKVVFEKGPTLTFDSSEYSVGMVPMSAALYATPGEDKLAALEGLNWQEEVPATVTFILTEASPAFSCRLSRNAEGSLRFYPAEEIQSEFHSWMSELVTTPRPLPGDWFRDTVCYLDTVGLAARFSFRIYGSDTTARRSDFVEDLNVVAGELLTAINEITDYPDSAGYLKDIVLPFYNAGILTGIDEFGTFNPDSSLSRAEMAAMAARLVRPALRLKFQPTVQPEKYRYTLTYLMDGDPNRQVIYPVCILDTPNDPQGILTLDGTLIPFPGGKSPVSLYPMGDYYWCGFWVDGTEQGGLIDKTGSFILPLQSEYYYAWPVGGGGFLAREQMYEKSLWFLLDDVGKPVRELGYLSTEEAETLYPRRTDSPYGVQPSSTGYGTYYANNVGHPVSEAFDWAGALTGEGKGFVGVDGKIYRIQFEER